MLTPPDVHFAHRFGPAARLGSADVIVRCESDAALERALALAQSQPWVADCRVEPATRTLRLSLCSGAAPEALPAPVLH